jgi:hypothetical protein
MIAFLRRYMARRRFRPVVGVLPRALADSFGAQESYTFAQVNRVVNTLRLPPIVKRYAYAVACTPQELDASRAGVTALEYQRFRTELADLFDLVGPNFTIKHLLASRYSIYQPAPTSFEGIMPQQGSTGRHSGAEPD